MPDQLAAPVIDLKTAAFRERLTQITDTVVRSRVALTEFVEWLDRDIPAKLIEGEQGWKTVADAEIVREELDKLQRVNIADFSSLEDLSQFSDQLMMAATALHQFLLRASAFLRVVDDVAPKRTEAISFTWLTLTLANPALLSDIGWLLKLRAELELPYAASMADRAKRMRERRKSGYQMVQVAIHKSEIQTLRRLGLLGKEDSKDSGAVGDAVQSFLAAAFASATPDHEFPGPDTEFKVGGPMNKNRIFRAWPMLSWAERFIQVLRVARR